MGHPIDFDTKDFDDSSPFHIGEQAFQAHVGVREQMERFGRQVIRNTMPEQHQNFYQQLPFVLVGHADQVGNPWASILFNQPGFIQAPSESSLKIEARPVAGEPLRDHWQEGTALGLLGIELPTRRRNRLSATIAQADSSGVHLKVNQTFGNCPQYIQSRQLEWLNEEAQLKSEVAMIERLDTDAQNWIRNADTFFVASYVEKEKGLRSEGADVSHRGGRPGFVRVDDEHTLTIPDYLGNNHFNTLGNLLSNPRAGLLFVDFERGHLLMLTGRAEILWDSEDAQYFEGAQRLWRFHLTQGRVIKNALPFRWSPAEFSANSLLTGTWEDAEQSRQLAQKKEEWLTYKVVKKVRESVDICSLYLSAEPRGTFSFLPGQFLTLRAQIDNSMEVRTYTLSSAPADDLYRISVKREQGVGQGIPAGKFSNFLHDRLAEGDVIEARAPAGAFTYDAHEERPAVLLSGGVGVTPMISMARHNLVEAIRTRSIRPMTLVTSFSHVQQRAFYDELIDIEKRSNHNIRHYAVLGRVDDSLTAGVDYHHVGRVSPEFLQAILPIDDYDFYLCGPPGFMQHCYDILRNLGVSDSRIYAEAFGPASLVRKNDESVPQDIVQALAEEALVTFEQSQVEQAWQDSDGSLLELAEAHGLQPDFACRSGQCGACKVPLLSGKVVYTQDVSYPVEENEVLLCCAKPAEDPTQLAQVSVDL